MPHIEEGEGIRLLPKGDPSEIEIIIVRRKTLASVVLEVIIVAIATGLGGALTVALLKFF